MRADARRNQDAIIGAARALFVERGLDVPLEAIAGRADVGIATLYRRFPDRAALVRAVALDTVQAIAAVAAAAVEAWDDDPQLAWAAFADALVALRVGALIPTLGPARRDAGLVADPEIAAARADAFAALAAVTARAQAGGQLRPDVTAAEVLAAVVTATRPLPGLPAGPDLAHRLTAVVLAGLRPDGQPLPGEPWAGLPEPSAAGAAAGPAAEGAWTA